MPDLFCLYTLFTDVQTDGLVAWNKIFQELRLYIPLQIND